MIDPLATCATNSFGWLHLTDLHCGLGPDQWLWPNVREELFDDLAGLHERSGPWSLVLFTGDLTQRGSAGDFRRLDESLDELWHHLGSLGPPPKLLVVPGNHDLVRPPPGRAEVKALRHWDKDPAIREDFWSTPDDGCRRLVEEVFAPFREWLQRCPHLQPGIQSGLLPGDFSVVCEAQGLRLGIVGLNSAFLQLDGGDYDKRLDLHVRQLNDACGGDGVRWLAQNDLTLLMTHHPPTWLSSRARDHFQSEIDRPGRFFLHLFGHMHEGRSISTSEGGATARRVIQGASLLGLEHFGTGEEHRVHGYSASRIFVDGETLELRVWPRVMTRHQAGHRVFVPDTSHSLERDESYVLCREHRRAGSAQRAPATSPPPAMAPAPAAVLTAPGRRSASPTARQYLHLQRQAGAVIRHLAELGQQLDLGSVMAQARRCKDELQQEMYTVVVAGRSRAGKSTLLNALLRRHICPAQALVTTAVPISIRPGEPESATVTFADEKLAPLLIPGPLSVHSIAPYADQAQNLGNEKKVRHIEVRLAHEVLDMGVSYVDIPGIDDPDEYIERLTTGTLSRAHALIYVLNAASIADHGYALDRDSVRLLNQAKARKLPLFFICNKADRLDERQRQHLLLAIERDLGRHGLRGALSAPPILMSAQQGFEALSEGRPAPEAFAKLEEALWQSLWNAEDIGIRRVYRVFDRLRVANEEIAALIQTRQAQGPERERLRAALSRCRAECRRLAEEGRRFFAVQRDRIPELIAATQSQIEAEISAQTQTPPGADLPRLSDVTKALRPRAQALLDSLAQELLAAVQAEAGRLEKEVRASLTTLRREIGLTREAEKFAARLGALPGFDVQDLLPTLLNWEHPTRVLGAGLAMGAMALAAGLLVGGPVGLVVLLGSAAGGLGGLLFDQVLDRKGDEADLRVKAADFFRGRLDEAAERLRRALSESAGAVVGGIEGAMRPFMDDMASRLEDIRLPSPEEIRLQHDLGAHILAALQLLEETLQVGPCVARPQDHQ